MFKSGLILAVISFLLATGLTLLSPMCVPCAALFLGLGAGFLAGVFDKPAEGGKAVKIGAISGVLGGIGAIVGQIVGTGINALIMGPGGAARFLSQLGMETGGQAGVAQGYWIGLFGGVICFGFLDIALMAGFGIIGALTWRGLLGKKAATV